MAKKTIIVSNRLPVTIQKGLKGLSYEPSAGGLATGLGCIYKKGDNIWIGWPGFHDYEMSERDMITSELQKENMVPVFLSRKDVKEFYEGFSNKTIWPLFHYFTEFAQYDQSLWKAYERVNHMFSEELLKYAHPEDVIWIHDYQLLLLPGILRDKLPEATIGFFLHIPFPSFEIFRLLPWRTKMIEGILGADLIGFHTYDDIRHFLSAVNRILGLDNTVGKIRYDNRLISVDAFPMGIDYEKYQQAPRHKETIKKIKHYTNVIKGQKMILSIDRLDYTKGIKQRLEAFDLFLQKYPKYLSKVSLFLIVVPSRDKVGQYKQLKEEIDTMVGRLDGKYSRIDWTPIHYFYRSFSFHGLSALYSLADAALITPLRDGMNLVCKEYIASKLDSTGVLILSEMAGSAKELSEAISINPNDQLQIVQAIDKALSMPREEQIAHNKEMQEKLQRYNIHNWVDIFMKQLIAIKEEQAKAQMWLISENRMNDIAKHYRRSDHRILFLDYDGTLKGFSTDLQSVKPDKALLEIIKNLVADKKNKVVIISGRDRDTLEQWLGNENLDLIAEHGVWYKLAGKQWQTLAALSSEWKPKVRHILENYVDRTPGSFIEDKHYSLVWHYRKAAPGFGEMRARELLFNISFLTANMDLQAMEGNKVIEVKSRAVNKGLSAAHWLKNLSYDFVLALGDDRTDEDTFKAMPEYAYTVKVGLGSSQARFNVKSYYEVRKLLKKLYE